MLKTEPCHDLKEDLTENEKKYLYELWIKPVEYRQWQNDANNAYAAGRAWLKALKEKVDQQRAELSVLQNDSTPLNTIVTTYAPINILEKEIEKTLLELDICKEEFTTRLELDYIKHTFFMTQLLLLKENLITTLHLSIHLQYFSLLLNDQKITRKNYIKFNAIAADIAHINEEGELSCLSIDARQMQLKDIEALFNMILRRSNPNKGWSTYYNPWQTSSELIINFLEKEIREFNLEYNAQKNVLLKNPVKYSSSCLSIAPSIYAFEKDVLQDCKNVRDESREYLSHTAEYIHGKMSALKNNRYIKKFIANDASIHIKQDAIPHLTFSLFSKEQSEDTVPNPYNKSDSMTPMK